MTTATTKTSVETLMLLPRAERIRALRRSIIKPAIVLAAAIVAVILLPGWPTIVALVLAAIGSLFTIVPSVVIIWAEGVLAKDEAEDAIEDQAHLAAHPGLPAAVDPRMASAAATITGAAASHLLTTGVQPVSIVVAVFASTRVAALSYKTQGGSVTTIRSSQELADWMFTILPTPEQAGNGWACALLTAAPRTPATGRLLDEDEARLIADEAALPPGEQFARFHTSAAAAE